MIRGIFIYLATFRFKNTKHDQGHFSNLIKFQSKLAYDVLKISCIKVYVWEIEFENIITMYILVLTNIYDKTSIFLI